MRSKFWKNQRLTTWAIVTGLAIFLHWTGLLSPVENVLTGVVAPLAVRFQGISTDISEFFTTSSSRQNLQEIVNQKNQEISDLQKANADLQETKAENDTLRKSLNFFTDHSYKYVVASVVSREVAGIDAVDRNKLIINKGYNDGLRENLAVINELGLVVGKITKVKDRLSEVSLLVDNNCRLAVAIQGGQGVSGIAQGDSGLTVKINFIPQSKTVNQGDLVVTAGLENDVPGSLVIGKVSQIDKATNDLWQEAVVTPAADLDNLKIVSVIISPPAAW